MPMIRAIRGATFRAALLLIGGVQVAVAQAPYELRARTLTRNDTLVQGVPGRIEFVVEGTATDSLKEVFWPIRLHFSQSHLLGHLSDTGAGANVGFVQTRWGAAQADFSDVGGLTLPDTVTMRVTGTSAPFWTGTGEMWRIVITPSDTGRIIIDTAVVDGAGALSALGVAGGSHPVTWQPDTIAVVPYCPSGDLNADGRVDHGDLFPLVRYVFFDGELGVCPAHADVTCSGEVNAADIMWLIHYYLFADRGMCYTCNHVNDSTWACSQPGP